MKHRPGPIDAADGIGPQNVPASAGLSSDGLVRFRQLSGKGDVVLLASLAAELGDTLKSISPHDRQSRLFGMPWDLGRALNSSIAAELRKR